MKLVRWLLALVFLGALGYAAYAIPLDGQTLYQRLFTSGAESSDPAPARVSKKTGPAAADKGQPASVTLKADAVPPKDQGSPATDVHTEDDRAGLNRLIESKLNKERGDAPADAPPTRP